MSRTAKIWLITAAFLILVGCIIFLGVMTALKWDFMRLSTVEHQTVSYDISEEYGNIAVVSKTADIAIVPSENGNTSVVCYEDVKVSHSVSVKDGTLFIEVVDTRNWYEYIGVNFNTRRVTVYVPKGYNGALSIDTSTGNVDISRELSFESVGIAASTADIESYAPVYGAVKIAVDTGDIRVENVSVGSLELSVSTGDITLCGVTCAGNVTVNVSSGDAILSDVTCVSFSSVGGTGDIGLKNTVVRESISIKRTTGDVSFERCDAATIFVETDTGDVEGRLLSDKVFVVSTSTGDVEVPKTTSGGTCEIITSTGDVEFAICAN